MIDPKQREKLKGLEAFINGNILGQREVVREMVPILMNGELGINSQREPKAKFLLLGPPGVGKTEVCNAFTDYLLGSDKLVRVDMSEYQTLESIYRLLGRNGEEGLLGMNYDRVDGAGTLLFDEIEKAHERVLDLFLQLLSAARITLGSGRVLNLEGFYVAATSNIGSPLLIGSKTNVRETLVRRVIQEARDQMRPEIFDRFDRVLVFNRLSYDVQIEVGRLHLQWEIETQRRWGHKVTECDTQALKAIVRNGYSEKEGARRMRNAAREAVQEAIREALPTGGKTSGRLEYNDQSKSFFINGQR